MAFVKLSSLSKYFGKFKAIDNLDLEINDGEFFTLLGVDNLPRILPAGLGAVIKIGSWDVPAVFRYLAAAGEIPEDDLWRTFNMGVGMVLVVAPKRLARVLELLREGGCPGFPMGNVVDGDGGVELDHPPEGYPSGLR